MIISSTRTYLHETGVRDDVPNRQFYCNITYIIIIIMCIINLSTDDVLFISYNNRPYNDADVWTITILFSRIAYYFNNV